MIYSIFWPNRAPLPDDPMSPVLFLIDGSSQMYRAYHAIRGLTGPDGRSTNAVYGFVTMLRKLMNDHRPEYIASSFDVAGPTFRSQLATDYKANRASMPADLAEQIPLVHRACEALGVPVLTSPGFEADDVIGTIAERTAAKGYGVAIVTGDKDFFQLVRNGIRVYNPKDEGTWYDAAGVKEKLGVTPDQVIDVLALMGDSIDNVKGVPGIGEKGARELIAAHQSLDRLLASAGTVAQKKYREALQQHADDARQSRELLRIRTDVPIEFDIESFRYRGASREACYELFSQLGFRSLVMEYAPTAETTRKDYALVDTPEQLDALVDTLRSRGRFAFRVLADGPSAMLAAITGIALSGEPREARYIPLRHRGLDAPGQLDPARVMEALKTLFEDPSIGKIGHDLKFDCVLLERCGISPAGLETDTMVASYLLDATRSGHPLEDSSLEYLGYKALTDEDLCGRGAKAILLADVPVSAALDYAGERADLALQLADRLAPMLVSDHLDPLYRSLEMPLIPVLVDLERAGVRLDGASLAAQSQHIDRELQSLG
jgi:DNA polymerase I